MNLKEECLNLLSDSGLENIMYCNQLQNCDETKNKKQLSKLRNFLKEYTKKVKSIRQRPIVLVSKEGNRLMSELNELNELRDKIQNTLQNELKN